LCGDGVGINNKKENNKERTDRTFVGLFLLLQICYSKNIGVLIISKVSIVAKRKQGKEYE